MLVKSFLAIVRVIQWRNSFDALDAARLSAARSVCRIRHRPKSGPTAIFLTPSAGIEKNTGACVETGLAQIRADQHFPASPEPLYSLGFCGTMTVLM